MRLGTRFVNQACNVNDEITRIISLKQGYTGTSRR